MINDKLLEPGLAQVVMDISKMGTTDVSAVVLLENGYIARNDRMLIRKYDDYTVCYKLNFTGDIYYDYFAMISRR